MVYTKADAPVQKSIATAAADTPNARRYRNANAQVLINPQGKPVAFRRVRVLQRGTFAAASRLQVVTPRQTCSISRRKFDAYKSKCHPLN